MEKGFFHPSRGYWQTTNTPSASVLASYPEGTVEVPLKPGADFEWVNGAWQPTPPAPPPVPDAISFAQLLIGLVSEQWITEAEGEAWLAGTLPAPVLALIATLPAEQQFPAKARAIRPSEVLRADPLVNLLGVAQGKTGEDLDQFFRTYAQV
jgi:hypothetical protein